MDIVVVITFEEVYDLPRFVEWVAINWLCHTG